MEWKWSTGEKYEKSERRKMAVPSLNTENTAIRQSLLSEDDRWVMNQEGQLFIFDQEKPLNKREDTYNRMAERELVGQIGMNPFLQTDYCNDIMVQDKFLQAREEKQ